MIMKKGEQIYRNEIAKYREINTIIDGSFININKLKMQNLFN